MLDKHPHNIYHTWHISIKVLQINILLCQWLFLNISLSLDLVILVLVFWYQLLEQALHKEQFTQVLLQNTQEVDLLQVLFFKSTLQI